MRDQDERKESIFKQSVEAERNKEDLFEKNLPKLCVGEGRSGGKPSGNSIWMT